MSTQTIETYETRPPDGEGWRGVPFRHPADAEVTDGATADGGSTLTAEDDGGKHDGGPMPPEAPRDPAPSGGNGSGDGK
ncbi:hypothetical protein NX801_28455 [Streptomyces sp. LP05-1]|uniref:Uncharacterized protein n=1 Tax=Streptomyces pyxinae TaxID=2970734 RepID=A0ABT2CS19_9ACTN|nr:hypothetical protein [Streptomyces sp. LP05-1]MCS0639496.1 hypothetical protein [Streptomyces sp. LP05-1]